LLSEGIWKIAAGFQLEAKSPAVLWGGVGRKP
jgi:hypothetical protein